MTASVRPPNLPPDPTPELDCLPPGLRSPLFKALAGQPRTRELLRTALNCFQTLDPAECGRAFGFLAELPPGPLRGWWLRAVFDLPGWTADLARSLGAFLTEDRPSPGPEVRTGAALEFVKKASRILRGLGRPGRNLLRLIVPLARSDPQAALDIFLLAPEALLGLEDRDKILVLNMARRLPPQPQAAAALLGSARSVLTQAGRRGFAAWLRAGLDQDPPGLKAYLGLTSPLSRRNLDRAAGGLSLAAASKILDLYGRTLSDRPLRLAGLGQAPEGLVISPLAPGGRAGQTVFLHERERGRQPLAVFRARLALVLEAEAPDWEFLLSFDDPWLAADLWALAAGVRAGSRLAAKWPGLKKPLTQLNRVRRAGLNKIPVLLHPALKAAARRLWGGRIRGLDPETAGLARRIADLLLTGPDLQAAAAQAYALLAGPGAKPLLEAARPQSAPMKFGPIEDRRPFETGPGLKAGLAQVTLTLSRSGGRAGFMANLAHLAEKMRRQDKTSLQTESEPSQGRAFLYPEWDQELGAYRPDWVRVVEGPRPAGGAEETVQVRPGLIRQVRRQFQRIRPRGLKRLTRQREGMEVDLEAAVTWTVDRLRGEEPQDKVYLDRRLLKREVACGLLIDLSGSTAQRLAPEGPTILQVAQEGLSVLAEALAGLGDSFGLFGFTGSGRTRVDFAVLKDFHEPWSQQVRGRLGSLKPGRQNRDGAALRHTAFRLASFPARRRILFFISDGRPDDYGYAGDRALADTRAALKETRRAGIKTFGLTIDRRARDYVGRMMGSTPFVILDKIESLPAFLPRLYRRLAG